MTGWLGKGRAHIATGQQLLQAGPHKPCMSPVMLPGEEEEKLKVELLLLPGSEGFFLCCFPFLVLCYLELCSGQAKHL